MTSELENDVYESIRDIVYQKAGINLGSGKQALVSARLGKRLRALELQTQRDYLDYLLADTSGEEIVQLLDVISTNHTYFFRENDHFVLLREYLQKWMHENVSKIRIWCAAASTGEEPYTLAMVCNEVFQNVPVDLRILASDISTRVLRICHEGVYPSERMREVSAELKQRWWHSQPNGNWSAKEALRQRLTFARLNLMETPYPMKGPFDVVICRNVMIYFDRSGREKFVREAIRLLRPGGLLIVGHAESLAGIAHGFVTIKPSVYFKPEMA